jgi:lauroyl/myristoyl acyltransferase
MALVLACVLWTTGFKRKVFRRNREVMRWKGGAFLYMRLCFHAAQDLLSFVLGSRGSRESGSTSRMARFDAPSQVHLEAMRRGPSILLTAHFHNWERLASALRSEGVPLLGAARPLRAAWAERWLLRLRRRMGVHTVSESVPRAALQHLTADGCFGLLWDQHAPASEKSGRFFGAPVQVNPLPFFLLKHRPCPVYFGVMLPGGNARLISLMTLIDLTDLMVTQTAKSPTLQKSSPGLSANGVPADWEDKLTRRYHRVLEILVTRHPYLWYGFFHARFKNVSVYPGHRPSPSHVHRPNRQAAQSRVETETQAQTVGA